MSMMQESLTNTGKQVSHYADEVIKWADLRPEESEEAIKLAVAAAKRVLEKFDDVQTPAD